MRAPRQPHAFSYNYNCLRPLLFCFVLFLYCSFGDVAFSRLFFAIAVSSCMESTLYVFLPNDVFLPCDHGLESGPWSIYLFKSLYAIGSVPSPQVTQLRPDGVHCQESACTGPVVLEVVPVTGAAFAGHHGPIHVHLYFPHPLSV